MWLSFETVVLLDECMRQNESKNNRLVEMLGRPRDGVCSNINDYNALAERGLRPQRNVDIIGTPVIITEQCNTGRDIEI